MELHFHKFLPLTTKNFFQCFHKEQKKTSEAITRSQYMHSEFQQHVFSAVTRSCSSAQLLPVLPAMNSHSVCNYRFPFVLNAVVFKSKSRFLSSNYIKKSIPHLVEIEEFNWLMNNCHQHVDFYSSTLDFTDS